MEQSKGGFAQALSVDVRRQKIIDSNLIFEKILEYLEEHRWPVVPMLEGAKQPLSKWKPFQKELPTVTQLVEWWERWPDAGVAVVTGKLSGVVVIDVDKQHGGNVEGLDIPANTFRVKTPHGGQHLYFKCPRDSFHLKKIKSGFIYRGIEMKYNTTVTLPPSNGYEAITPIPDIHPPMPTWVWQMIMGTFDEGKEPEQSTADESTTADSIFARLYLQSTPAGRRNHTVMELGKILKHHGVTNRSIMEAILKPWYEKCEVGEDDKAFPWKKVEDAVRFYCKDKTKGVMIEFCTPKELLEMGKDISYAVENMIPQGTLTLFYGKPHVGKTLFSMLMMKAIRSGTKFLDHFPVKQGPVMGLFLDDPINFTANRLVYEFGLPDKDVFITTRQKTILHPLQDFLAHLRAEVLEKQAQLVVVDSLFRFLKPGSSLSQAPDMAPLVDGLDALAEECQTSVVLIHHPRRADEEPAGSYILQAASKCWLSLTGKMKEPGMAGQPQPRELMVDDKFKGGLVYHNLNLIRPGEWQYLGEKATAQQMNDEDRVMGCLKENEEMLEEPVPQTNKLIATAIKKSPNDTQAILDRLEQQQLVRVEEVKGKGRPSKVYWLKK